MKKWMLLILFFFSLPVHSELRINVDGAKSEPTPIAISTFTSSTSSDLAKLIPQIIATDLERSKLFRVIDEDAYIQNMDSLETKPTFSDWQAIGAHALIHGQITEDIDGKIQVSFRLWDTYAMQQLDSNKVSASPDSWRKIAHVISDIIYERLTGEKGFFDTQITFIAEKGSADKRERRLALMDQDGANLRYLTDGKSMAMTPRFSPNGKEIVYMSYQGGKPQLHLINKDSLTIKDLGHFEGMSFAPRFSLRSNGSFWNGHRKNSRQLQGFSRFHPESSHRYKPRWSLNRFASTRLLPKRNSRFRNRSSCQQGPHRFSHRFATWF